MAARPPRRSTSSAVSASSSEMHSHITFGPLEPLSGTSSARWPIANCGSVPTPTRPASSRIQLPWSRRSSASVVHGCPPTGTYWRASSQIGQRDGDGSANCVPHVAQTANDSLLELLVGEVFVRAAARADAGDDRFLRPLVQALTPALHGSQELVEVH